MTRGLKQSSFADSRPWETFGIHQGIVKDTNDPQQMGRLRVHCSSLNDDPNQMLIELPWACYGAPFGGTVQAGSRGPNESEVTGPVAYGMWAIPKEGSTVLIMCLEGNPNTRVWLGCLHTQLATHTMPHGRFTYKTSETNKTFLPDEEAPVGPISTVEDIIEPLHTNLRKAFDAKPEGKEDTNFEFQTRGADFQVSGLGLGQHDSTFSLVSDDEDVPTDGLNVITGINSDGSKFKGSRQGYQTNRFEPTQFTEVATRNLDNTVTAIVSPGFHGLSMDDRQENCRIRIRTTGGHQIIFDDTNERIYIATAKGENWIEMDEQGNIDIYTSGKISAHAEQDINFTSDKSFRVYAKAGIHLKSDAGVRIDAKTDIEMNTNEAVRIKASNNMYIDSADFHVKSGGDIKLEAGSGTINVNSQTINLESSKDTNIKASGNIFVLASGSANIQGSSLQLNAGTSADGADTADNAEPKAAFFTNRVPNHEPWGRSDTLNDETIDKQMDGYTTAGVSKFERITSEDGTDSTRTKITRGKNWRR